MSAREDLLKKLGIQGHLSVPERQALGTVHQRDVIDLAKSLLLAHSAFPNHNETEAVYEGATLTLEPTGIQIMWRRAYPWDPFSVAESRAEIFSDLETAIQRFIDSEWGSGIDGISWNRPSDADPQQVCARPE